MVEKVVLPNINRSLNVTDPNRIEGKKQTSVDVGDVIELKYMKEKGAYNGKVVKFSRSKITRSNKRDKDGKLIGTKASGGELIIDILWLDAPAAVAKGVIGDTQSIVVADFLRDYKIQSAMRKIQST